MKPADNMKQDTPFAYGQFTGRYDGTSKPVFEGDVLRVIHRQPSAESGIRLVVPYSDFTVEWDPDFAGFAPFCYRGYDGETFYDGSEGDTFVIIGKVTQTTSPTPDPTSA